MLDVDRDYYQRRVEQELCAAADAATDAARRIHLELVDRYCAQLALADAIRSGKPCAPLGIRFGSSPLPVPPRPRGGRTPFKKAG